MSVLVHVSSMKTKRSGAILFCRSFHRALRRATSGRSRSLATTLFFEAELLSVDEVPDRPIVHLETALGKLRHKTPQREGLFPSDAIAQKDRMSVPDRFRLVSAIAGRKVPVSRTRFTQSMTVLGATPK